MIAGSGVSIGDVREAADRIRSAVHRTPVLTSRELDARTGAKVFIKAECYQRAGAFKIRGAMNKLLSLPPGPRGVFAWSSGNHAQAVALGASIVGRHAVILMPEDAPAAKRAATEGYGAEVIAYDRYHDDRARLTATLARERDLIPIPAFDDPFVIAGQGTVALELLEDVPDLDVLLVCTSGGGLTAGCATVMKALLPQSRVFGVEPRAGNDTKLSFDAGKRIAIPVPATIADGQQVECPGEITFDINRRLLTDVLLVSDDELREAMRFLFERMKVVAEPSGASALAALLSGKLDARALRVGVTLSGGNVGIERFCRLMSGANA